MAEATAALANRNMIKEKLKKIIFNIQHFAEKQNTCNATKYKNIASTSENQLPMFAVFNIIYTHVYYISYSHLAMSKTKT